MVATWLIIGIAVFLLLVFIYRSQNTIYMTTLLQGKIFYLVIILIILFLAFSLSHIYNAYNLDLTTLSGVGNATRVYFAWLKSLFSNFGRVSGYVVQQDWILGNATK